MMGIALLLIGAIFWLIYTANTFKVSEDNGNPILLNTWLKYIFYGFAGFLLFIIIQIAYNYAIATTMSSGIISALGTTYQLFIYLGVITLFLLFFGIFGNLAYKCIRWLKEYFTKRG